MHESSDDIEILSSQTLMSDEQDIEDVDEKLMN